jgi:hypothetical protein
MKKEEWRAWAVIVVSILFFVVLGVLVYTGHPSTDFDHYDVGNCLYSPSKKQLPDSILGKPFPAIPDMNAQIEKVSCVDPKANYQILKLIPGDDEGACKGTPGLVATYTKKTNYTGYTLCLGDS